MLAKARHNGDVNTNAAAHATPDTPLHLDVERCSRALAARDRRFDGRFIVGVTSTGIYCRPSCPTPVHPKPENTRFFATAAAAQVAGLRACKRCQPDATPGSPDWDRRDDLVGRAMRMINDGVVDREGVDGLAARLGVGPRHLRRILLTDLGAGPTALARARRAHMARVLIERTSLPMSQLAFASGFGSVRQFNSTIREVFASDPSSLRDGRGQPSVAEAPDSPGFAVSLRLPYRAPLASAQLFQWLAVRAIPGVAEGDETHHRRGLRLPHGDGVVALQAEDGFIGCSVQLASVNDLPVAISRIRRLLDLDADPNTIGQHLGADGVLAKAWKRHPGLRVAGSADGFETAVFAVMGQQRSVKAAVTLTGRIVEAASAAGSPEGAEALGPFPTPSELLAANLDELGLTKRNIATVRDLAHRVAEGAIDLDPAADRNATRTALLEVHGIGPWTADYILMRALGDPDVHLPGDLVVRKVCEAHGVDLELDPATWRPWRSYATHLLWSLATASNPSRTTNLERN